MKSLSPNAQEFIPILHYNKQFHNTSQKSMSPCNLQPSYNQAYFQKFFNSYVPQQQSQLFTVSEQQFKMGSFIDSTKYNIQYSNMLHFSQPILFHQNTPTFIDINTPTNLQWCYQDSLNNYSISNTHFQFKPNNNHHNRLKYRDFRSCLKNRETQPTDGQSLINMTNQNKTKYSKEHSKAFFERTLPDKELPTSRKTDSSVSKSEQSVKEFDKNKMMDNLTDDHSMSEVDNEKIVQSKTNHTEIVESYIIDKITLEKIVQNVNFLKKTAEQHFLKENSDDKLKPFFLKEALLNKPTTKSIQSSIKDQVTKKVASNETNRIHTSNTNIPSDPDTNDNADSREKSKWSSYQQSFKSKKEGLNLQADENITNFDLKENEFPILNQMKSEMHESFVNIAPNKQKKANDSSFENPEGKISKQSDEYPCVSSPGKRSNRPIIVEFANMITALERGQKEEKIRKKAKERHWPGKRISRVSSRHILKRSCTVINRGKEQEKAKQKKQSTLKKIILKEREEKRLLGTQSNAISVATIQDKLDSLRLETELVDLEENLNQKELNIDLNKIDKTDSKASETENSESDCEETMIKVSDQSGKDKDAITNKSFSESCDEDFQVPHPTKRLKNLELNEGDIKCIGNRSDHVGVSNQMSPISQGSPISMDDYTPQTTTQTLKQLANNQTLITLEKMEEQVKEKIHNRKFREYCNQIINREIDEVCYLLLHEIVMFQDRMYHKNPAKAKSKRRYVMGIREVTKHLKLKKLKCVILAPNCEKIKSKGGLDDAINTIIQVSMEQNIPFLFALGRKALGKAVNKLVPISVVGIFDYTGADEYFRRLVGLANNAKLAYQDIIEEYEKECQGWISESGDEFAGRIDEIIMKKTPNLIVQNQIVGHSRNSSNASSVSMDPVLFNHSQMNYRHTHSRSGSGNFNFGYPNSLKSGHGGHSRSASSGGVSVLNSQDLGQVIVPKPWTHSRTPSNCSNISFISRMSEPISEVGSCGTLLISGISSISQYNLVPYYVPHNSSQPLVNISNVVPNINNNLNNAVQYYSDQVRQEMKNKIPEEYN